MAYQAGVTASLTDLITTLQTFCVANGFTIETGWSYTNLSIVYDVYVLKKNGIYFNFAVPRTGTVYLFMNTASANLGTGTIESQTGAFGASCRVDYLAGPHVGYHFFADELSVNVAVEVVTNVFTHINFGELEKNGAWSGGQFVTGFSRASGTSGMNDINDVNNYRPFDTAAIGSPASPSTGSCSHVRNPVQAPASAIGRAQGTIRAYATGWASNAGRNLIDVSPNAFNGRAVLVPINIVLESSGGSGPYYQLGTVHNARHVNIANLQPKETVNTDWMVFPVCQKNGPGTNYPNSGNYGMAYKK